MLWSYLVKGTFPKYAAPKEDCRIDHKWSAGEKLKLGAHARPRNVNFLLSNIVDTNQTAIRYS